MAAGGADSNSFVQFKNAPDSSPRKTLFEKHIAPDVAGSTFFTEQQGIKAVLGGEKGRNSNKNNFSLLMFISNSFLWLFLIGDLKGLKERKIYQIYYITRQINCS